eukprot:8582769-Alexandrium_andersonii.AAC.1
MTVPRAAPAAPQPPTPAAAPPPAAVPQAFEVRQWVRQRLLSLPGGGSEQAPYERSLDPARAILAL